MLQKLNKLLAIIPRQQFLRYNKRDFINLIISCYEQILEFSNIMITFVNDVNDGKYKGEPGKPGDPGEDGKDGDSAYDLAVKQGFHGTESEWIRSLAQPALDAASYSNKVSVDVEKIGNQAKESAKRAEQAVADIEYIIEEGKSTILETHNVMLAAQTATIDANAAAYDANAAAKTARDAAYDIRDIIDSKQDKLKAGKNITITNNVISAADGFSPSFYRENVDDHLVEIVNDQAETSAFRMYSNGSVYLENYAGSTYVGVGSTDIYIQANKAIYVAAQNAITLNTTTGLFYNDEEVLTNRYLKYDENLAYIGTYNPEEGNADCIAHMPNIKTISTIVEGNGIGLFMDDNHFMLSDVKEFDYDKGNSSISLNPDAINIQHKDVHNDSDRVSEISIKTDDSNFPIKISVTGKVDDDNTTSGIYIAQAGVLIGGNDIALSGHRIILSGNVEVNNNKVLTTANEWFGTQEEFDAITEYKEGINYYIYD